MQEETNKKLVLGGAVAAVAIAVGGYFFLRKEAPPQEPVAPESTVAAPEPEHHPVPEPEPKPALPELADSDNALIDALGKIFSAQTIEQYLVPKDIVRHIVVTVDNLPRKKAAERLKPIKPIAGQFLVQGPEEDRVLSESNYARYQPFVQAVNATDTQQLVDLYVHFYPLFQQAYVDLGYPSGYFNDRLVEVIDHLLATPDVAGPIKLTQPGVLYEFADAKLENLSAGQKALIRVGKTNAAALKTKLREIRAAVVNKKS